MRIRNESSVEARLPFKRWIHPDGGSIQLSEIIQPGEIADSELVMDPEDPEVQKFLKDQNLRIITLPDRFERILKGG